MCFVGGSWVDLPPELRFQILEVLLHDGCSLAELATVSREWQAVIELFNFARIHLTPERLFYSGHILHQKRSLVRYIWFSIELQRYGCSTCTFRRLTSPGRNNPDHEYICMAISNLFSYLSTWELGGDLVLDLSVYSPSDPEHWFKYLDFRPDVPSGERSFPLGHGGLLGPAPIDDVRHGWVAGRQESCPHSEAINTIFHEIMAEGPLINEKSELAWWRGLPSVSAVTGLLLRQQSRRQWNPQSLVNMLSRFPNLKELCHEPWRYWGSGVYTDKCNETLMESLARANLRKVVLFENFNDLYHIEMWDCDPIRKPSPAVSHKLARASLHLESLSASFMVDASYFFEACEASWTWPNLTSLALTSRFLIPETDTDDIDNMLLGAAAAALRMPKLSTMEIWNGRKGIAMAFRYQTARNGQSAIINDRGTTGLAFSPAVIQAWQAVALRHRHSRIRFTTGAIDPDLVKSHGDAIYHLGLSMEVVRPVSLRQILKEHRVRAGEYDEQM